MPTATRLGLWCCRADRTGLGNQTYDAYKYLKPTKTMVIDIKEFNGNESDLSKYPDATVVEGIPDDKDIYNFLQDLDVVMCFETPYNYDLFSIARDLGVKTILQYNYEFLDYLNQPHLPKPDLLVAPSKWHFEDAKEAMAELGVKVDLLEVPVDREVLPLRDIKEAKTFLHIAGKRTFMDRNGTDIVLGAIPYVKSDVKFIIKTQQELPEITDPRVTIDRTETPNYYDMYDEGDVLLMPRKYGGLCLPLNEAMSRGMIPVMTDCEPQSMFLREESLVTPFDVKKIMTRTEIDCYETSPTRLAEKIDELANLSENQIKDLSNWSDFYAMMKSWDEMLPRYWGIINGLNSKRRG